MTLDDFICKHWGHKVDYDGAYGAQCVDLYRQYCKDVLNVPQSPSVGGAKEIFYNRGVLDKTEHSPTVNYRRGDILVWNDTKYNPYGHVAIFIEKINDKLLVFEQDGFKKNGAQFALRSCECLLGCLHFD